MLPGNAGRELAGLAFQNLMNGLCTQQHAGRLVEYNYSNATSTASPSSHSLTRIEDEEYGKAPLSPETKVVDAQRVCKTLNKPNI